MQRKHLAKAIFVVIFLLLVYRAFSLPANRQPGPNLGKYYEKAIYTDDFGLSFYPDYPPEIGQNITLRLRTFSPAQKVTFILTAKKKFPCCTARVIGGGNLRSPRIIRRGAIFLRFG